jgi:WD40 repeat protein
MILGEPTARFTHGVPGTLVAILPDGRRALSTSADGTVKLWDLFSANEIRRFEGQEGGANDAKFTPDGSYVLSGIGSDLRFEVPGDESSIRMWDVETGEMARILEGALDGVWGLRVSPDGRKALSISSDGIPRL